jgi:hypothetical protein
VALADLAPSAAAAVAATVLGGDGGLGVRRP